MAFLTAAGFSESTEMVNACFHVSFSHRAKLISIFGGLDPVVPVPHVAFLVALFLVALDVLNGIEMRNTCASRQLLCSPLCTGSKSVLPQRSISVFGRGLLDHVN